VSTDASFLFAEIPKIQKHNVRKITFWQLVTGVTDNYKRQGISLLCEQISASEVGVSLS
jgi:hypothetical protein